MTTLWREIRSGIRALWKSPGTAVVATLTLALGIGANTAIFSLLNALVLRSLPVPHPEQLIALATTIADDVNGDQPFSLAMFDEMDRRQQVFSELFAWDGSGLNTFEAAGRDVTASLATVTGTYYRAMQVAPLLGRYIEPRDVALHSGLSSAVAVISYRAWRTWYHGDANIIGQLIRIGDHHPFTIIGVEPESYSGLIIDGSADVTIPVLAIPQANGTDVRDPHLLWLRLYGRLRPGVTLAQAKASTGLLWPRILEATPPVGYGGEKLARFMARRITLESAATGVSYLRKRFSSSLWVLLGLVGAVLLVACLNLANLTLARSAARRHDSGVRSALGASSWDLMKEPMIEAFLLTVPGALLGLGVAYWASRGLLQVAWTGLVATSLNTAPDWRVLAFTAGIALGSGLLFSAAPAWSAAHTDPLEALRYQSRSVRGSMALGKTLLVAQMALSLMLVSGALLFGQTLNRLYTIDVGYRRDHLLTMLLFPQPGHRATPNSTAYFRQLTESMHRLPGVESASFSNSAPANEYEFFSEVYRSLSAAPVQAVSDFIGPDFFHVVGMHVLAGREFDWRDDGHDPPKNVIVSQSLARKLFGGGQAVDQIIYLGPHARAVPVKIVGVANNASLWKVESVQPMALYTPLDFSEAGSSPLMVIRTATDPRAIKAETERVVRSFGHQYSLRTATVEERLDTFLSVQRLTAMLAAFFGAVALLIASIGLYGLMSFYVSRRTAELGVRLALGAQPKQVLSMVLREVLGLAVCGCALGIAGSLFAARLIKNILFGVSATDPVILAAAVFSLVSVALVAGFVPARRAAGVDPAIALRVE